MKFIKKKQRNILGLVSILFVAAMLVVLIAGTGNVSSGSSEEGVNTVRQTIERAAILCYATEGFYPPNLEYVETRYGVQINRQKYIVRYDVFASNIKPGIAVIKINS